MRPYRTICLLILLVGLIWSPLALAEHAGGMGEATPHRPVAEGGGPGKRPVADGTEPTESGDRRAFRQLLQGRFGRDATPERLDELLDMLQFDSLETLTRRMAQIDEAYRAEYERTPNILDAMEMLSREGWANVGTEALRRILRREPEGVVRGAFRDLLGRKPRDEELTGWMGHLHTGGPEALRRGLQSSNEYKVRELFRTLLGRYPNPGEGTGWEGIANTRDIHEVAAGIRNSPEYRARWHTASAPQPSGIQRFVSDRAASTVEFMDDVEWAAGRARDGVSWAAGRARDSVVADLDRARRELDRVGSGLRRLNPGNWDWTFPVWSEDDDEARPRRRR